MKHPHAELIKAWADGAVIQQYKANLDEWHDTSPYPVWDERVTYRIKPEPKPNIEKFFILEANPILGLRLNEIAGFKKQPHEDWIRVVFDGETFKMKFAEVLK